MTVPDLPQRKVPGWLYAALFLTTVTGYVLLVLTGHSGDTSALLLVTVPILSSVFVADRVSATARSEGETTRHAISNGEFTLGLVKALDHPEVVGKLLTIVQGAGKAATAEVIMAVEKGAL